MGRSRLLARVSGDASNGQSCSPWTHRHVSANSCRTRQGNAAPICSIETIVANVNDRFSGSPMAPARRAFAGGGLRGCASVMCGTCRRIDPDPKISVRNRWNACSPATQGRRTPCPSKFTGLPKLSVTGRAADLRSLDPISKADISPISSSLHKVTCAGIRSV